MKTAKSFSPPTARFALILTALMCLCLFSGCATTGWMSKTGYAFIGIRTESGGLTYNKGHHHREGEACARNILGFLSFGNSGIAKAKRNGGLESVFFFDTEIINVGGLFGSVCTKVYGK